MTGQVNPAQHTSCTQQGHGSKRLAQEKEGADGSEQWIEVDVVGSADGAQTLQDDVPHHKAHQRCQQTQEKQVEQHRRRRERRQGKLPGVHQKGGQDGEQAIEKDLAGDEYRGITVGHTAHNEAVDSPGQSSIRINSKDNARITCKKNIINT